MFSYMVANAIQKSKSALIFTHREEILLQAGGTFEHFNLEAELINAGSKPDLSKHLHITMVETFNRRLKNKEYQDFLKSRDLIIIDEAHIGSFDKIFECISDSTFVIGATATPERKGNQSALSKFYTDLIDEVSVSELIELGYLVKPRSFGVDLNEINSLKKTAGDFDSKAMGDFYEKNKIFRGVISNYERLAKGRKTIVFTPNVESSENLRDQFLIHGYNAKHIDGKTSKSDRKEILRWFESTYNAIICNCGVLTTGFDQPDIGCVILYRATTSRPLFMQMAGRGGRINEGKKDWLLLDFGENIRRFGKWEDDHTWSLEKKKKNKDGAAPVKICPECGFMMHTTSKECDACGFVFLEKEPEETPNVQLTEIKDSIPDYLKGRTINDLDMDELIKLQLAKKYKASFIWRVVRSRGLDYLKKYASKMGYSSGWVYRQEQEMNQGKNQFKNYVLR